LFFEMTVEQLSGKLKTTLDEVLFSQAKKNIPLVYRNNFCVRKDQFIHEYTNGKKFLIQQDPSTSKERVLREL